MAGVPWHEKAPKGLKTPWYDLWRGCLRTLKEQGTWSEQQKPLLDEYVFSMRQAVEHREVAEREPFTVHAESGRIFAHPGFSLADQATKRAAALADVLVLTPKSRRALGVGEEEPEAPDDAFAEVDELASRRRSA